jgi:hypothetical protein
MHSRPSLVRNVPFWILLAVSLVLTGVGTWIVLERLGQMESAVATQSADAAIQVYVGPSFVFPGAVILGAGLIGLLLTLAVAAAATLRPRTESDAPAFGDGIDEDETLPAPGPFISTDPDAAPRSHATAHAEPVIAEDPDVETPSDATPPARA